MKTLFEKLGGTYTQQGDYYLPDIKLPEQLKASDQIERGMRMNNIQNRATEIVNTELIYKNIG